MITATPFLDGLGAIFSDEDYSTDEEYLSRMAEDSADGASIGAALVVVFPRTTEQVSEVVKLAFEHRVPVVPQGARSGLVGGATSVEGAVLLNLTRMDRIIDISVANHTVTCEPGVNTAKLIAAVAAEGLFYPPDPGSMQLSTIGGNIATNAGGMQCLKYGTTGRFVRSLTAVTGTGEVITVGHDTVKGVAGLDIVSLLVGSEGTLGIVTEATLALLPAPGPLMGAYGVFTTMNDALEAANAIVGSPYGPAALEVLDGQIIRAINVLNREELLPPDAEALLIVQSDTIDRAEADIAAFATIFTDHHAVRVVTATEPRAVADIMDLRRQLHPAMRRAFGSVLNEDIAVPRGRLLDLFRGVAQIADDLDVPIATGGHVGDGNLHPLIGFNSSDPASRAVAEKAFERVMALAAELGGTITGEHGVGTLKRPVIDVEIAPGVRELQRGIKAVFDPAGILNPGKKY